MLSSDNEASVYLIHTVLLWLMRIVILCFLLMGFVACSEQDIVTEPETTTADDEFMTITTTPQTTDLGFEFFDDEYQTSSITSPLQETPAPLSNQHTVAVNTMVVASTSSTLPIRSGRQSTNNNKTNHSSKQYRFTAVSVPGFVTVILIVAVIVGCIITSAI